MTALRYRLARWLVGAFVTIPERQGVWVVTRYDETSYAVVEAGEFTLKIDRTLAPQAFGNTDNPPYFPSTRTGTFSGTVKG